MSVSYGKGAKAKATKLHSQIIRSIGFCENCGSKEWLQCAHIISRRYNATRTDLRNAHCLCAKCHRYFTLWPREYSRFISGTSNDKWYDMLKDATKRKTKMKWSERVDFLLRMKDKIDANALTAHQAQRLEAEND